MLVLTRQVDQELMIGDRIRVKILETDGKSVKLGIEAPREIAVHRAEVYRQIAAQNQAAAQAAQQRGSLTSSARIWAPASQYSAAAADREQGE